MFTCRLIVALALMLSVAGGRADASKLRIERIFNGKGELSLPAELARADEKTRLGWHQNYDPPADVFIDENGGVSIATSAQHIRSADLDDMLTTMARLRQGPDVESWLGDGKRDINGRPFGYVEFNSRLGEGILYNYMYFTMQGDILVMIVVNAPAAKLSTWKPVLEAVISSSRIVTE